MTISCEANQTLSVSVTKKVSTGLLKPGITVNLLPERETEREREREREGGASVY